MSCLGVGYEPKNSGARVISLTPFKSSDVDPPDFDADPDPDFQRQIPDPVPDADPDNKLSQ